MTQPATFRRTEQYVFRLAQGKRPPEKGAIVRIVGPEGLTSYYTTVECLATDQPDLFVITIQSPAEIEQP